MLYRGLCNMVKLEDIIKTIKQYQYQGRYGDAIVLIKDSIQSIRLTRQQYYQLVLLLQSCYYNNNQIQQAKRIIQGQIQHIQNEYYLCKFYLAYASVMFRYVQPTTYGACVISLQLYNKSKQIYQQNLIKNNQIFISDRQLYSKILINILIISNMQIELSEQFKQQQIVDYQQRFMFPNKKYFYIIYSNKKYTINHNICLFIQNLLYLQTYLTQSTNKQFIQYYQNLYMVALSHIISDAINYNITQCFIQQKLYTISQVISKINKKIQHIDFNQLSYTNKQNYLVSINKIVSVFTNLIIKIYYATNIIKESGLYLYFRQNFLLFKQNHFIILQKLQKFVSIQKRVFEVDLINLQYKFKSVDDLQKIQIIQQYVNVFNVCQYYYGIVYKIFSKINNVKGNILNQLTHQFIALFDQIYNNFFQFLQSDRIFNKLSQLRNKITKHINMSSSHSTSQLNLTYKTILYFMSQYYFFNQRLHQYILIKTIIDAMQQQLLMQKNFTLYQNINQQYKSSLNDIKRMQQLKQSNAMLQNFTHILAHDIKTPLRTISSYAQLLKYQKDQQYIDVIIDNSKSLYNMVQSSLKYVSIDKQINKTQFNLYDQLIQIIRHYSSIITKSNILIEVKNQDNFPKLYADKELIKTVIQNLLTNAIKACNKENSTIQFGCLNQNWFYIKDNGRGIKPENKQKIFNLFYRQHKIDQYGKSIQGTGFGLAIVKRILQKHQSTIKVQSQYNQGTMVLFSLNSMKNK